MKKVILLASLLFFISLHSAYTQTDIITHQFEFSFAPKIVYQSASVDRFYELSNDFSYALEFSHLINIKKHFVFKYGLSYSGIQLNKIDYLAALFSCDVDPNSPLIIRPNNSWIRDDIKIHYLGIPIDFKLRSHKKANSFYLKVGVERMFKLNQNSDSYLVMCGAPEEETENEKHTEVDPTPVRVRFGIGYEFKVGDRYQIFIEPNYEYLTSYMYENPSAAAQLSSNVKIREYGLRVGMRM